jgi:hypothetical protein
MYSGSGRRGRWAPGLEEFKEYLDRSKSITMFHITRVRRLKKTHYNHSEQRLGKDRNAFNRCS